MSDCCYGDKWDLYIYTTFPHRLQSTLRKWVHKRDHVEPFNNMAVRKVIIVLIGHIAATTRGKGYLLRAALYVSDPLTSQWATHSSGILSTTPRCLSGAWQQNWNPGTAPLAAGPHRGDTLLLSIFGGSFHVVSTSYTELRGSSYQCPSTTHISFQNCRGW